MDTSTDHSINIADVNIHTDGDQKIINNNSNNYNSTTTTSTTTTTTNNNNNDNNNNNKHYNNYNKQSQLLSHMHADTDIHNQSVSTVLLPNTTTTTTTAIYTNINTSTSINSNTNTNITDHELQQLTAHSPSSSTVPSPVTHTHTLSNIHTTHIATSVDTDTHTVHVDVDVSSMDESVRIWKGNMESEKPLGHSIPQLTLLGRIGGWDGARVYSAVEWFNQISPLLSATAVVGGILTYLVLTDVIGPYWSILVFVLVFPLALFRLFPLNLYLLGHLCYCFEFWFLIANLLVGMVCAMDMMSYDIRVLLFISWVPLMLFALLLDCLPIARHRRIAGLLTMILAVAILLLLLYAGKWKNVHNGAIPVAGFSIQISDSFGNRMITLLLFAAKYTLSAFLHPNCFVLLSSRLQGLPT